MNIVTFMDFGKRSYKTLVSGLKEGFNGKE